MHQDINRPLLFLYWSGSATPMQRQLIKAWLAEPAHQQQYYQWLIEWEEQHPQTLTDPESAWNALQQRIDTSVTPPDEKPVVIRTTPRWSGSWWLVAACGLLLMAFGYGFYRYGWYVEYKTGYGQIKPIRLTDGSTVVLNANSSLRVPRFGFGNRGREVFLTGEANFDVAHTPDDQRFVVRTARQLDVVVLGTEFTVFARPRQTKVVLARGKVLINYPTSAQNAGQLTLKPGDLVTLDSRGQLKRATTRQPRTFAAWQRHQLIFENTSLREVGQMLAENYGLQVEINSDELARQTLTGSFHADSADELLQAISDVMDIRVVHQDQQVLLTDTNTNP